MLKDKRILFGICGSFCNHAKVLDEIKSLCECNDVQFVVSENVFSTDTRFFKAEEFLNQLQQLSTHPILHTIQKAEQIGPRKYFDLMVIAPMTASVASKIANGDDDHPVTLAAKAMLRNKKNIVFGIATNDGLGSSAKNIFSLLNYRNFYAIPFRQDAPFEKERSIVAEWSLIEETCQKALENEQIQPILLGGN